MKILPVSDSSFAKFGKKLSGFDFSELLGKLDEVSSKPNDSVVYVPSDSVLESLPIFVDLRDREYGGMPIQIGYCNGTNYKLNCVEYHRDSEINVASDDVILLVGAISDIADDKYDTGKIEAFLLKKGDAVEIYATTLHYAPCSAAMDEGFRVVIVLPKGTNTEKPEFKAVSSEDGLMTARNKWLLAHQDTNEARSGAYVGLVGENIDVSKFF